MAITVKYFGAIEEVTGMSEETLTPGQFETLEELKAHVVSTYRDLQDLSFQLALNQQIASTATLNDGDEIAFLPPFAGG